MTDIQARLEEIKKRVEAGLSSVQIPALRGHYVTDIPWLIALIETLLAEKAAMRDATLEECARICKEVVNRPAGYNGQWEGYGASMGDKTGTECAIDIRALKET